MAGVVLVLGPDRFLVREAVARVLAEHEELEVTRFPGAEASVAQVLDELRTPTLLGARRAVVVEDVKAMREPEALDALAAYAKRPVAGALLVLAAASLDGRLKAVKALREAAEEIACTGPRDWEVPDWLAGHARERYGLSLGLDTAKALCRRVGEDLGELDAALKRLAEQIAPRTRLAPEDVEESTGEHRSPALFEAANALEARDLPSALAALDAAFREGIRIRQDVVTDAPAVAPILLSNLHQAYGKLLRFHMLARGGASPAEAARQVGVSPRAARYFLERAARHRLEALVQRHGRFVEADLALKGAGSGLEPRQALERLLVDLLA